MHNISISIDMLSKKYTEFDAYIYKSSILFQIFSDKNRLSICAILSYGQYTVSDIYKCLRLRQNLISHHLKILKKYGFVKGKRQGKEIYYSLCSSKLKEFESIFNKLLKNVTN